MKQPICILKGNLIHTPTPDRFVTLPGSYLVAESGIIRYLGANLPATYQDLPVTDYGEKLILPGFVDIHAHAPQFCNRGLGMDQELLPWLETYTFPEEAKYEDLTYAGQVYRQVVTELWRHGTTRSVLFASLHTPSTLLLMRLLSQAGLSALVGKVNMDRNSPDYLCETTADSLAQTRLWLEEACTIDPQVRPIITPRFVPSCTSTLMTGLGELAREYQLPVQSHLSENRSEIDWVNQLHPDQPNYASVYRQHGLLGQQPTIMAHCVHLTDAEIDLLAQTGTLVAHCPYSNNNLSSGIAPLRQLLSRGVRAGLATDISGGHHTSMAKVIGAAVQMSKMKWAESQPDQLALTLPETFYLATKGGGSFFGQVGCFETGFSLDALVIDDSSLFDPNPRTLEERLERWLYIGDDRQILARYVAGRALSEPVFTTDLPY